MLGGDRLLTWLRRHNRKAIYPDQRLRERRAGAQPFENQVGHDTPQRLILMRCDLAYRIESGGIEVESGAYGVPWCVYAFAAYMSIDPDSSVGT